MKQRVTAILGALVLVVVAVFVRGLVHDRTAEDGGKGSHGGGDAPVVACTTDLQTVCDALVADGKIAPDVASFDLADVGDTARVAKLDGWITWDPVPEMLNLDPAADQKWGAPIVLRSTSYGIATSSDSRDTISDAGCQLSGTKTITCLGQQADKGNLSLGIGDPKTSEGLIRLGLVASGYFDDTGAPDRGALQAIEATDARSQETVLEARAQLQPGLGSDAVIGPGGALDQVAKSAQGQQREINVTPWARPIAVVITEAPNGSGIDGLVQASKDSGVATAWTGLGLGTPGGDLSQLDPGELYQVWKLFS